jgi:membrane associated rhomboid family serine protease
MQCPSCDGKLKEIKIGKFIVTGCKLCDGFWIKKNDVNPLLKYLIELKNNGKKFQSISKLEREILNGQMGRYCPDCGSSTQSFEWGESEIVSFSCSKNCGVWMRMKQLGDVVEWYELQGDSDRNYRFFRIREDDSDNIISGDSDLIRGLAGWISDDIKVVSTPVIVISLIILNILCFLLYFLLRPQEIFSFYLIPTAFLAYPLANSYSLITSMFMHADFGHILGNMFFLYLFGKALEDRIGKLKFIWIYLFAGLIASMAHISLTGYPQLPTLGASGAVSGVMGGYLILFPKAKISFHKTFFLIPFKINLPAWFYLGVWFVGQQLLGIVASLGAVAWYAHLFGFVSGMIIVFLLKLFDRL